MAGPSADILTLAAMGVLAVWALFPLVVAVTADRIARAHQRIGPHDAAAPDWSVTMLRPCAGHEPSLRANLESIQAIEDLLPTRVEFLVTDETDRAFPDAQASTVALQTRGFEVTTRRTHAVAPNHKVAQLAAAEADIGTEWVWVVDSDVDLTGFKIETLAHAMRDDNVAAVWVPPVETPGDRTLGDRVSHALLNRSLHAFPLLGRLDSGSVVGKCLLVRTTTLRELGGFARFEAVLGEDMALGQELRSRGFQVQATTGCVVSRASGRSLRATVERFARWVQVIRSQRPGRMWSYPALFASHPLALLAWAGLVVTGSWETLETNDPGTFGSSALRSMALFGAGLTYLGLIRLSIAAIAKNHTEEHRPLHVLELPMLWLADVGLLIAFVRALYDPVVTWRGRRLSVGRGGVIQELPS